MQRIKPISFRVTSFSGFLVVLLVGISTTAWWFDDSQAWPTNTVGTRVSKGVSMKSEVLIYITTVFSDEHQRYLRYCWPKLLHESRLLSNAHFMIFSNNVTALDEQFLAEIKDLFLSYHVKSFEFKFADGTPELEQYMDFNRQEEMLGGWKQWGTAMQYGANMAMSIGLSAGWFQPYDWIVRINPDVLIRQSDFLIDHVDDPSIDAIILWCRPEKIHTDFFAVRPQALAPDAFAHMQEVASFRIGYDGMPKLNAEFTAANEFKAIIESERYITVPDVTPSKGYCRVRGPMAPVVHQHGCCSSDHPPLVCDELENWHIK